MEAGDTAPMNERAHHDTTDLRRGFSVARLSLSRHPALWIAVVDLLLVLGFGVFSQNHVFFNNSNFTNMALESSQVVMLAAGSATLLGAAELDISLGANVILSSIVGGRVMVSVAGVSADLTTYQHQARGIVAGVAAAIATGTAFGLVNGLIVTRLRVNSFITTLGTLGIGTGLSLVVSGGSNVEGIPFSIQNDFGIKELGGVPLPTLVAAAVVLVLWLLLAFTRFGLHIVAIGSSRAAATRAGIDIDRHVLTLFVIVGFLAGVSGVIDISRFATTNLSGHQTDALAAIAGAVIGGTSLFGGRVSIPGAIFGAFLAVILQTGLVILGLQPFYQLIAIGTVLILAVFIRSRAAEQSQKGGLPGRAG
jgi:ribose transport system permease protein